MRSRGRVGAVVLLLVVLHGALSLWSATRESATYDEVAHIGAGYSHLVLSDWRSDVAQAPIPKLLAALAIRGLDPPIPVERAAWKACSFWVFGFEFLYGSGQGRALLLRARLPFIALGMLLVVAVFAWAREAWGSTAGLVAAFLAALNPELLAHSHYANSDLPIALVTTVYLWGLWRFVRRPTLAHGAWVAAAFAVAAVTKYSFPILVPASLAVAVLALAWRERAGEVAASRLLLRRLVVLCVAGIAAAVFAAWASCGFRAKAAMGPDLDPPLTIERMLPEGTMSRSLLLMLRDRELLPEAYATGVAYTIYTPSESRHTFLLGRSREGGTWLYFPVALAIKTPIPLLVLAFLGTALRRRDEEAPLARSALLAPIAVYAGTAMIFGYNIGYRHLLPLLPLLCVLAGRTALLALATRGRMLAAAGILAWQAAGTAWVAPHFLSYFNEIGGGPTRGNRWLADSNCDWGQDLDELGRWCEREGVGRVKLSYFGNASMEAAGLDPLGLPGVTSTWRPGEWAQSVEAGDVVAISVTNLRLVYFPDRAQFPTRVDLPGLTGTMGFGHLVRHLETRYRPAARAGYSIVVYRLEREFER